MGGWDGTEPPTPGFSDPAPPPLWRPSCPTIASIPATFLQSRRSPLSAIPRMSTHDFSRVVAEWPRGFQAEVEFGSPPQRAPVGQGRHCMTKDREEDGPVVRPISVIAGFATAERAHHYGRQVPGSLSLR